MDLPSGCVCSRILVCKLLVLVLQIVKGAVKVNLFRPLWFIWTGNDGYGSGRGYLQIKIFYFLLTKNIRKMARA